MRNIMTTLFSATLLVIVSFGTLGSLGAQEKPGEFRDLPVRKEVHRQYQLAPNTTAEISMIAGPVEIETIYDQSAEINIVNSAETQADLNCLDTPIEQTREKLVIRSKSLCKTARVNQRVTLKTVVINGRIVMRDRRLLTLNETAVKNEARAYRDKIIKTVGTSSTT